MTTIPRTSGIYQILCIPTGKVYIGSTKNLHKRRREHWLNLDKGMHVNVYLQSTWDKYGAEAFTFTVLELVEDADQLVSREQHYLDSLQSYARSIGFNQCSVANSTLGVRYKRGNSWGDRVRSWMKGRDKTAEERANISRGKKGKTYPNMGKSQERTYRVIRPTGEELIVTNLTRFCRSEGLHPSGMLNVACGINRHYKGWRCERI